MQCLQYGKQRLDLTVTPERFANELYRSSNDNLTLLTDATYRARITQPEKDDALIALQQSLAEYSDQKKASSIHVANAILPEPKNRFEAAKQSKRGDMLGITRQLGGSPSFGTSPAPATTYQYHDTTSSKTRALRHAVIHLLAMRPLPAEDIAGKVRIPVQELKAVLQTLASLVEGKWKLTDKACKELDVWRFKYPTQEDRQAAINAAIRAYDRLRLSRDDKLWQLLLPKTERGQGKVLSRLHLGSAAPPRVSSPSGSASNTNSPRLGSQGTPTSGKKSAVIDRLLSKDPKKARAEVVAKDKKRKERDSADEQPERPNKRQATTKKAIPKAKSSEFVHSSDEDAHSDSKTSAKSSASDRKAGTHARPTTKPSGHVKASASKAQPSSTGRLTPHLNGTAKSKAHISPPKALRPTVPSPLGAARPRVASDVSDRSGISQRRNDMETPKGLGITSTPRARHDTITSVDLDRPKFNKSAMDSQDRSQKSKRSDAGINGYHKTSSTSSSQVNSQDLFDGGSSDSSMSVIDTITFGQGIDLAMKFQDEYYPQYTLLYDSIHTRQQSGEVVGLEDMKKLWEMHKRIQQIKRELEAASERQRAGHES